jgi:heme oxygenase
MTLDEIKAATWPLHTQAERSGVIADILAGTASREAVALLLRNLLPVYRELEVRLADLRDHAILGALGDPALARGAAIEADLAAIGGDPVLLAEGAAYAERIAAAPPFGLVGHAYTRYLGDLNGGRLMRRRLLLAFGDCPVAFHDFPAIDDLRGFTTSYRAMLDRAVMADIGGDAMREAMASFEHNIALSDAVRAFAS